MVSTLKSLLAALGAAVNLNAKPLPIQVTGGLNLLAACAADVLMSKIKYLDDLCLPPVGG